MECSLIRGLLLGFEVVGAVPNSLDTGQAEASDALLVAAPEYGHSLPGVLKNAIDWLIGSGELERKVVAITASVPAAERGRQGLAALRQTLGAVRAMIVSDEPVTRGSGSEETIRDVLRRLVDGVREARQGSGQGERIGALRTDLERDR